MRRSPLFAVLVSLFTLAACQAPKDPAPGELASSSQERITTAAPSADLAAAVSNNTEFGLDLYRKLKTGSDNLVFSPHSISVALSMAYGGSANDTAKGFEQAMHQSLPSTRFHRAMNTLDLALASRGQGAVGKDGGPFRLNVNNQLFSQTGFALETPYLDLLAAEYGSGVRLLDFETQPEPSRQQINSWVENNTNGLIPELLPAGTINEGTRLALVNTVYFNAGWKKTFDQNDTHPGAFAKLDGSTEQVQMMSGEGLTGSSGVRNGVEVVTLAYDGEEVDLVILAPPVGTLASFEAGLTAAEFEANLAAAHGSTVNVQLPKFDFKTRSSLNEILIALGLGEAFSPRADFTAMRAEGGLQITNVVHEAVIKTDEAGTEAAAATGVIIGVTSVPSFVQIDRPFVFAIRDRATGTVIFLGRVVDP
jgi:serpin B